MTAGSGRTFCSDYSVAAGEQLVGTANPTDVWLLVEDRSAWQHSAVANLPDRLQQQIRDLKHRFPTLRVALIKRDDRRSGLISTYWAFSREQGSSLYRYDFESCEQLDIDPERPGNATDEKLFAVCTHGTHDLCCGQLGNRIFLTLRDHTSNAWRISHVGGCRFAPNLVCLPDGLVYGRVEECDVAGIVSHYERERMLTDKLRGRSCYAKPVQAAEWFLRRERNLTGVNALRLISVVTSTPEQFRIRFVVEHGRDATVCLSVERGHAKTFKSCVSAELSDRDAFKLDGLEFAA